MLLIIKSLSTPAKNAIKVALAFCLAIYLALYFNLEKPYWAAIVVNILAITDTITAGKKKGILRLLGTLCGAFVGLWLIAVFGQDRYYFLANIALLLAICIYMGSDPVIGYAYITAFIVCILLAISGSFDGVATFNIAVLRLQETLLGFVVYTTIYSVVWPEDDDTRFNNEVSVVLEAMSPLIHSLAYNDSAQRFQLHTSCELNIESPTFKALNDLMRLPDLHGRMPARKQWKHQQQTQAIWVTKQLLQNAHDQGVDHNDFSILNQAMAFIEASSVNVDYKPPFPETVKQFYQGNFKKKRLFARLLDNSQQRLSNTLVGTMSFISAILVWIYLPISSGSLFIINSAICALILSNMPRQMIKHWTIGYLAFGSLFLIQYVLLLPSMTEVWQLMAFYFVNVFTVYRLFAGNQWMVYRVLGGNLLVMITMSATQLVPVYDVTTPLNLLIYMMVALAFIRFYTRLIHRKS
ncbi:FUSC family protein [Vibrio sp. F13]|uniref:FUSC family protein n=1 Tax=Vibrio sp. F13 TaxID=2070777 RepID=UPI0010BD37A5|nr:FUSC family protein [Vibrio sp. F13]TKF99408.1 FUSC family protein [Vibrio sp. F13]